MWKLPSLTAIVQELKYQSRLQEETNGLLREFLTAIGHPSQVVKSPAPEGERPKVRTEKDIERTTRMTRLDQQFERKQKALLAETRGNGPASEQTLPKSGTRSDRAPTGDSQGT